MKRHLKLGIVLLAVMMLSGCGKKDEIVNIEDLTIVIDTEATFYSAATTSFTAKEIEDYAAEIKENILEDDWKVLAKKISYPITLGDTAVEDSKAFLKLNPEKNIRAEFVAEIEAEDCRKMFCNYEGISMGSTGQLWFTAVVDDDGEAQLKIIGINDMF